MPEMILGVYGTLRRGGPANGLLRGAVWLGLDRVQGKIFDLGFFPGLRLDENSSRGVLLDLYKIPIDKEDIIGRVDKYEGYYPDRLDQCLYLRKEVSTIEKKMAVSVYEYRFPPPEGSAILTGDWIEYEASKLPQNP